MYLLKSRFFSKQIHRWHFKIHFPNYRVIVLSELEFFTLRGNPNLYFWKFNILAVWPSLVFIVFCACSHILKEVLSDTLDKLKGSKPTPPYLQCAQQHTYLVVVIINNISPYLYHSLPFQWNKGTKMTEWWLQPPTQWTMFVCPGEQGRTGISWYRKKMVSKDFIYLFLERGEGKEKERERNINVWLPLTCPLLGTWPATQACALTGNQTSDPLVHRLVLNPLSFASQGRKWFLNELLIKTVW